MRQSFNRKGAKFTGDINGIHYNQSVAGNALKVNFSKTVFTPADVDPKNVISRGQNFNYAENYQILPVMEWDTYFVQEVVLGMQEMGTFGVDIMFTLRNNDSLPSVRSLPFESENLITQSIGQDTPNYGEVLNSWWGGRFAGRSSSQSPNGIVMDNIRGLYRYRLKGIEWKLLNPTSRYPGAAKEVALDNGRSATDIPIPTNN